jgi:anthranilate synthase component II
LKLLILDNYDSFTYNLVHLVEKVSDISFDVIQNDQIDLREVNQYNKILLSPGPGLPSQAGIMPQLIKTYAANKSIFGVCLGMQAIAESFDTPLTNLEKVCHGLATPVFIKENDVIFKDCPQTFLVGRYHSWAINQQKVSRDIIVTAVDETGTVMAIRHRTFDVRGVQFHPESILSEFGMSIISNWLHQ